MFKTNKKVKRSLRFFYLDPINIVILSFSNKQVDTMAERMTAVAMPIIASLTKDLQTRLFMDVMLPEVLYLKLFLERHGLWLSI